ncbi:MAG: 7,8-didemethyl-8-hydroxy-5-deazariboflavin synthase subunit CofG [Armatimonadetes bacterium]|nr:MAG: 7,8-didemethyl-8-hydroxy-5-deazariboflavin synthase subunit CofG [Armatimonadota bacterium]
MLGTPDPDLALRLLDASSDAQELMATASHLRDEGRGRTVTYSRKVFVPITTLCRDTCTYCTFVKPPGNGGEYLTPEDVLAIVTAGDELHCTEALLTLGDRPEDKWPQARAFLDKQGASSTIEYVAMMSELIRAETGLYPHANPGVMSKSDIARLRPTNVSMGMMLENISDRLTEPGMPHHNCPDKVPAVRVETIREAGRQAVPFTTGILVGIGETPREVVDSLFALRDLATEFGHIQEFIIQNFRAKADTRMRFSPEPTIPYFIRVVALARWILGAEANLQVPPNLTEDFSVYLAAGINDWGGVSPLTIDWVNPEAPWPALERLEAVTADGGFTLRPRLPVYPEYLTNRWVDGQLLADAVSSATTDGYAAIPCTEIQGTDAHVQGVR